MNIQTITYSNKEMNSLIVVTDTNTLHVPWPCQTWHNEMIQTWLESNSITNYPLENLKNEKRMEINSARDSAINSGVTYDTNTYDTDKTSRENISGTIAAIAAGVQLPTGFVWRTSDNINVAMDATAVTALGATVMDHVNTQYGLSWALKATLDAATTEAEVNAITW